MWKMLFRTNADGDDYALIVKSPEALRELLVVLLGRVPCLEIRKIDLDPDTEQG